MPAVRCCCVPQEVGDAGPSRRIKGQNRGVETSRSRTHACSNFVIQEPELTGASNASTPTRVNQIVRRGSTNPLRRLRQRVVPLQRIQARNSVPPNADRVLGDQTRPRGCTRCTRLRRLVFARSQRSRLVGESAQPRNELWAEEAIRLSSTSLPALVTGHYGSLSLM
jgi:hypothetical protein